MSECNKDMNQNCVGNGIITSKTWRICLSWGERVFWLFTVALVSSAVVLMMSYRATPKPSGSTVPSHLIPLPEGVGARIAKKISETGALTAVSYRLISSDGTGKEITKISYPNYSDLPIITSSRLCDEATTLTRWIDGRGRELPVNGSEINGHKQYTAQLIEPVMPGDNMNETLMMENPKQAQKKGNLWTCRINRRFNHYKNYIHEIVQLPQGAKIVSIDPKPDEEPDLENSPTVRFVVVRDADQDAVMTIQYQLPSLLTDRNQSAKK